MGGKGEDIIDDRGMFLEHLVSQILVIIMNELIRLERFSARPTSPTESFITSRDMPSVENHAVSSFNHHHELIILLSPWYSSRANEKSFIVYRLSRCGIADDVADKNRGHPAHCNLQVIDDEQHRPKGWRLM